jgi:lauroyl/myristoyl acyltransferase
VERAAVVGYRSASWLLRTLPAAPTSAVLGLGAQGSYLLWPKKRDWSNQNFGHVLGLPPDDPRVRRLALRAYREYGRYLVELMRVPFLPPDQVASLVEPLDPVEIQRATQAIADAVAESIRPAPEQWYSFKPIWPATEAEGADLERRALAMQAGRPDPGPSGGLPRDEADQVEADRVGATS